LRAKLFNFLNLLDMRRRHITFSVHSPPPARTPTTSPLPFTSGAPLKPDNSTFEVISQTSAASAASYSTNLTA
jgi:hypothetical protein